MSLKVFCDGSCEPCNPSGYGCSAFVVFLNGEQVYYQYGFIGRGEGITNNVAEWRAVNGALRWIDKYADDERVVLMTDSRLVVQQINGRWACNKEHLIKLRNIGQDLLRYLPKVQVSWIPRERNEVADAFTHVAYEEARRRNSDEPFTIRCSQSLPDSLLCKVVTIN